MKAFKVIMFDAQHELLFTIYLELAADIFMLKL
jgi:hypothetical protein